MQHLTHVNDVTVAKVSAGLIPPPFLISLYILKEQKKPHDVEGLSASK